MITAVNSNNKNAYISLFEQASDLLAGYKSVESFSTNITEYYEKVDKGTFELMSKVDDLASFTEALKKGKIYIKVELKHDDDEEIVFDPKHGITSLEEYFHWLPILSKNDRKYIQLPLDEPQFIINANTRAINIPNEFKKNGVAVQGDDLGEVVYFEIDRYVDYMDLNTTNIFIQWELPKGPNAQPIVGVSEVFLVDIESTPGKLIFGWALSQEITKHAGQLKFSVRFYKTATVEENQIKIEKLGYSFSTLTATVNILPSIGLDIMTDQYVKDETGDRLINRIDYGVIVGGAVAAIPRFVEGYDLSDFNNVNGYDIIDEDGNGINDIILVVEGESADTGAITYSWRKYEYDSEGHCGTVYYDLNSNENTYTYIDLTEEEKSALIDEEGNLLVVRSTKPVFRLNGTKYERISKNLSSDDYDDWTLYYRRASYTPKLKDNAEDKYHGAGAYCAVIENRVSHNVNAEQSKLVHFPLPSPVTIENDLEDSVNLDQNTELIIECAEGIGKEKFEYTWYKKEGSYDLANKTDESNQWKEISDADSYSYDIEAPGYYKVDIVKTRNGEQTTPCHSNICRVYNPAECLRIAINTNEVNNTLVNAGTGFSFTINFTTDENNPIVSDRVQIIWYKQEIGSDDYKPISEDYITPTQDSSYDYSYLPDLEGAYKVEIINYVGTTSNTYINDTFLFT